MAAVAFIPVSARTEVRGEAPQGGDAEGSPRKRPAAPFPPVGGPAVPVPGRVRSPGHTYPGFTDSRRQLGQPRVPLVCRHLQRKAGGWQGVSPPSLPVLSGGCSERVPHGGHAPGMDTHEIDLYKRKPRCSPFLLGTADPRLWGQSHSVVYTLMVYS